jgi:deoxyribodipyrimidine photo-lyase
MISKYNPPKSVVIYWIRRDFRLNDNYPLTRAIEYAKLNKSLFIPLYILDDNLLNDNTLNIGSPRRLYLANILSNFAQKFDNKLIITIGSPSYIFKTILNSYNNVNLFINDDIEPYAIKRDQDIQELFNLYPESSLHSFADQLSINKDIVTGSGNVYSVFTPFKNAVLDQFLANKACPTVKMQDLQNMNDSKELQDSYDIFLDLLKQNGLQKVEPKSNVIYDLIKKPDILSIKDLKHNEIFHLNLEQHGININTQEIINHWYQSEEEALAQYEKFLEKDILEYKAKRDDLGLDTINDGQVSKMSVALKWGLVSARTLKDMILNKYGDEVLLQDSNIYHYISELIWREFYKYILYHNPHVLNQEFQRKYQNNIDWLDGKEGIKRLLTWMKGETGYPVVDACMKQILALGWMHNRSRMIVASILTKNLGINWRWGQEYFRLLLLDLDEASNNGGWQWASSTGSDPKPMRIFNPYLQAQNYDQNGLYQKKWLPHSYNYNQQPIIEHSIARSQALIRYKQENSANKINKIKTDTKINQELF